MSRAALNMTASPVRPRAELHRSLKTHCPGPWGWREGLLLLKPLARQLRAQRDKRKKGHLIYFIEIELIDRVVLVSVSSISIRLHILCSRSSSQDIAYNSAVTVRPCCLSILCILFASAKPKHPIHPSPTPSPTSLPLGSHTHVCSLCLESVSLL